MTLNEGNVIFTFGRSIVDRLAVAMQALFRAVSQGAGKFVDQAHVVLFPIALIAYLAGTLLYEVFLVFKATRAARWATFILAFGALANGLALGVRWTSSGRLPMANLFEVLSFWAWLIVAIYLVVERLYQQRIIGAFVAPLAFFSLGIALLLPKSAGPRPELHSIWFPIHVSFAFLAYTLFALAFGTAVIYLLQERQLKARRPHALYYRLPPLDTMDALSYRSAAMGFLCMTIALLTGAIWAEQVWGSYWSWDAKQTMALVTWLIYAGYFHGRNIAGWRGRRASWLLVAGFAAVVTTFLGVSFVSRGLHSFTSWQ